MGNLGYPTAGKYVKLNDGIYYVDCVTHSGAHLLPMSGRPAVIRTRKGEEQEVYRHQRRFVVISNRAVVEEVDPKQLNQRLMRRRIQMAKIEEANVEQTESATEAPAAAAKVRATQSYRLTNKAPKDTMKGQGKLVYDCLKEMGGTATVGELTERVRATGQLQTRQDAERVVGFYCSKFKREGIVDAVRPEVSQEQAVAAAV